MNVKEVCKLSPGDQVRFTDPDDSIGSMDLTIDTIEVQGSKEKILYSDAVVSISGTDKHGCYHELECFSSELS